MKKSKAQISKYCMILVFKNTQGERLAGNMPKWVMSGSLYGIVV